MTQQVIDAPAVVCSVLERDAATTRLRLRDAPPGCALVELRADHLRPDEIESLVAETQRPLIVTVRRPTEGGAFDGSEQEREGALRRALDAGARYVDVEWDQPLARLADERRLRDRVIVSHHGGACRFDELYSRVRAMARREGLPLKIVPTATSVEELPDLKRLLDLARDEGLRLAAFAMGRAGALSRLLGPAWGSWATYGSAARGTETAPGQYPAREMLELYDVLAIGEATRRFALIGTHVARSPSPAMHAAAYRALGIDGRYFAVEVDSVEQFEPLLAGESGAGFEAFAVTMPFKEIVAKRCEPGDALCTASAAVNTVLVRDGVWTGFNTDGPGALARIRSRLDPAGTRAAVLGAGGTARSIAAALVLAGADVTLFNRTPERAVAAARSVGATSAALERFPSSSWDLLIHATPRGSDGERFVDPGLLSGRLVLDAVYAGRTTALIRDARARGLEAIDGLELLAAQAILQFRHMTGHEADHELFHAAGVQHLSPRDA